MKIAIIGGGFTGLAAAYTLSKRGHQVTVFEKEKTLGGLAYGFREANWDWYLEGSYHHWFTNDQAILGLVKELGLGDKLIIKRPITANYLPSQSLALSSKLSFDVRKTDDISQFDSPQHLLTFPDLSATNKLRTALLLAFCKLNPFWQPLEGITAETLFKAVGGNQAWEVIWEPLMVGKFGDYNRTIAASWLWARIYKRTPCLAYIQGGFHTLITALEMAIKQHGGVIRTNTEVAAIKKSLEHLSFDICHLTFDAALLTVPTPVAIKLIPHLAFGIGHLALKIPHLHAQALILETKQPVIRDVYWLNITNKSFPFLAVVAHTNFMDKKYYGGHHLTYFGNYLPPGHRYLSLNKEQLLKEFTPFIKRLNPSFRQLSVVSCQLSVGWYAQPVHQLHYSQRAPRLKTGIPGIYLANLDSIYPWDRGTNYAVELGIRAAGAIIQSDQ